MQDQLKGWFDSLQPEPTAPTPTDMPTGSPVPSVSKRPTPVDCAKQGAAARRPSPCEERGGVAVPTTVGSGAPTIRFAQGGADYCVPYALAVDFLGGAAHADEAARGPSIPRSRGVLVKTCRWESGVVWSGTPLPLPLPSKRHRKAASSILAVVL